MAERSVASSAALLILLFVADAALSGLRSYLLGRAGEGIALDLRQRLVGRLVRLPVKEHDRFRTGDLLSRVGTDTTLLRTAIASGLTNAAAGLLILVGAIVLMALIDWVLLLVTLLCVTAATAAVLAVSSEVRAAGEEAQEGLGRLSAALERALGAIRTVKLSVAEQREAASVSETAQATYRAGVRVARLQAIVEPAVAAALQGSFVLVLGVGGARLASGAITVADGSSWPAS